MKNPVFKVEDSLPSKITASYNRKVHKLSSYNLALDTSGFQIPLFFFCDFYVQECTDEKSILSVWILYRIWDIVKIL